MPTPRETVLATLHAPLSALPATALRGEVLPEPMPAADLLILRKGESGAWRGAGPDRGILGKPQEPGQRSLPARQ